MWKADSQSLGDNLGSRRGSEKMTSASCTGAGAAGHLSGVFGRNLTVGETGPIVDYAMLTTFVASMLVSAAILYYVDLPVIRAAMQ